MPTNALMTTPTVCNTTVACLPYDVIRELCTFLEGEDIAALLRTCRNLYPLLKDDAIWLELCKRYGVSDAGLFGAKSCRALYTGLLHKYGPLLGLWASDHPYKGSVIEFRLDPELKGVVGEVWRFWARSALLTVDELLWPNAPEYFRFMHVALVEGEGGNVRAQLNWHVRADEGDYYGPGTTSLTVPTLHVVPETNQEIVVQLGLGNEPLTVRLPAFPPAEPDLWYDSARTLPRVKAANAVFWSTPPRIYPAHIAIISERTNRPSPPALMIRPSNRADRDPFAEHEARIHMLDCRNYAYPNGEIGWFYRRFYPLHSRIQHGQDPKDASWAPESLEGLWLGSYGPHGTEVLYLEHNREASEVRAWKVTGDLNVPRGACSWTIDLRSRLEAGFNDHLGFAHLDRLYRGFGTICSTGYAERHRDRVALVVSVEGEDELAINWRDLNMLYTPRYVRYKGRDISSETKEHLLRRPVGWTP